VKGVLSIALEARRRNRRTLIVPLHNAPEAAVVEGVDVYGATSLSEVVEFLRGQKVLEPVRSTNDWYTVGASRIEAFSFFKTGSKSSAVMSATRKEGFRVTSQYSTI
jgi:hypothetical protein